MAQLNYTRLTTAALNTLNATTLGNLQPYQIKQVQEYLNRVNWGNANSVAGEGSQSDVGSQPTIAQIVTLMGSNNP
jgi:hypothetical protein